MFGQTIQNFIFFISPSGNGSFLPEVVPFVRLFVGETVYLSRGGGGAVDLGGTQTYCKSISVALCCLVTLTLLASLCVVLLYSTFVTLTAIYGSCCQQPNKRILLLSCWQPTNSDWHIAFPKSQVTKITQK